MEDEKVAEEQVDGENTPPSKKRRKKSSFKSMLAGMMKGTKKDVALEKEALLKNLGGGAFTKVVKI